MNIGYAIRRALKGMVEFKLLTLATVSSVAVVLLLIGSFLLVLGNLSSVMDRWGKDVQVSCYLRDGLSDDTIFRIRDELQRREEVAAVSYVSKAEALDRFGRGLDGMDRILADLDENPLPASLEVRLRARWQRPSDVEAIAASFARPEFESMDWSREWVERFHTFVAMLRLSALLLGGLLAAAAIFLVSNTLRLAIFARQDELDVIALVGGTRGFARLPFLVEGLLQGLVGSAIALALLGALHRLASIKLQAALSVLGSSEVLAFLPAATLLALLAAGPTIGLVGAWTSVVRAGGGRP